MNQDRDDDAWFAPKLFGYGAGLPIRWQGWVVLLGYLALTIGGSFWFADTHPIAFFCLIALATIALLIIAKRKTRGGWRWRFGGD